MIVVDTSVWIDHLRLGRPDLASALEEGAVLAHPWVVGELALGSLSQRDQVISLLGGLPQAVVATPDEVMTLIDRHGLHGVGIGYVDAQLLASALLSAATLWTVDRRLGDVAARLGCAFG